MIHNKCVIKVCFIVILENIFHLKIVFEKKKKGVWKNLGKFFKIMKKSFNSETFDR